MSSGNYKSFKGTYLTVLEGMHQFIMYILEVVQLVRRDAHSVQGNIEFQKKEKKKKRCSGARMYNIGSCCCSGFVAG